MNLNTWVRDDEKTRSFHNKRLLIKGYGVFTMHVSDTATNGEKKDGFVIVGVEPYDLDAATNVERLKEYLEKQTPEKP